MSNTVILRAPFEMHAGQPPSVPQSFKAYHLLIIWIGGERQPEAGSHAGKSASP
jgi:hypothetical protein